MTPEEIKSKPTWDEVLSVLRSDKLRSYRVDIETDSTVEPDATEEKQQVMEFMAGATQFFQGAGPVMAAAPQTVKMFMEMFKFSARRFKAGRELEDAIEEAAEGMAKQAQQMMNAPPPPNPDEIKAKAEAEAKQAELQMKQQQAQQEAQMKQQEMQQDAQMRAQEAQAEAAIKEREAQTNAAVEMQKAQLGAETDLAKAELGARTDIEKAHIQADASRDIQRAKPDPKRQ